jgi:hypothetical protein
MVSIYALSRLQGVVFPTANLVPMFFMISEDCFGLSRYHLRGGLRRLRLFKHEFQLRGQVESAVYGLGHLLAFWFLLAHDG